MTYDDHSLAKRYRVWGETEVSSVAPSYSGYIDVWALG